MAVPSCLSLVGPGGVVLTPGCANSTANPKAAQRSSSTGLKDEKKKRAEKGHGWHGNAQKLLKQHFQASFCI